MELTSTLQHSSQADLTQQITELCRKTHLPGPYDPKHLPKDLRDEQEAYEKQMQSPCISKEVRSYQRNQGVQPMNNETDLRRQISW